MSNEEYHADTTAISKSGLDRINESPRHYWAAYLDPNRAPRVETAAMFEGTLHHTALLEPETMNERYVIMPAGAPSRDCLRHRNAKSPSADTLKNIAWWDDFDAQRGERLLVDAKMYDRVMHISDTVRQHPAARWLLEQAGQIEQAMFWEDHYTGAPCKCKPDKSLLGDPIFVDVKSTEDASPEGFARSVAKYRYDVQAAFYMDGADTLGERRDAFMFIAVEKSPPYAVAVYNAQEEVLAEGRAKYVKNLHAYMEALRTGIWPAYSDYVEDLQMPPYFFKFKRV